MDTAVRPDKMSSRQGTYRWLWRGCGVRCRGVLFDDAEKRERYLGGLSARSVACHGCACLIGCVSASPSTNDMSRCD